MATSIKIDDALKERIRDLAEKRRRSPHWIMREAISQYVAREEARESFLIEAEQAWQTYRDTGLHLTLDEVSTWLDTWEAGDESDPPPCHA